MFSSATAVLLMALSLVLSSLAQPVQDGGQPVLMKGYVWQNGVTPESYLLASPEQLKQFVTTLAPVLPYKVVPAPRNPDPFLSGFSVDFENSVIAVAVGRNRISNGPRYAGTDTLANGSRRVRFVLPAPTAQAYPFGWAVYSAVILPRTEGKTSVVVEAPRPDPSRAFPGLRL